VSAWEPRPCPAPGSATAPAEQRYQERGGGQDRDRERSHAQRLGAVNVVVLGERRVRVQHDDPEGERDAADREQAAVAP
jgi:hypothetical protein